MSCTVRALFFAFETSDELHSRGCCCRFFGAHFWHLKPRKRFIFERASIAWQKSPVTKKTNVAQRTWAQPRWGGKKRKSRRWRPKVWTTHNQIIRHHWYYEAIQCRNFAPNNFTSAQQISLLNAFRFAPIWWYNLWLQRQSTHTHIPINF